MSRLARLIAASLVALPLIAAFAGAAAAQPSAPQASAPQASAPQASAPQPSAPQGVEVTTLAAPDAFTTPGRDTGLPQTLWRGASVKTARTVLPLLAAKPLSPAAAALARRVLATGAPGPREAGPQGAGTDAALAAARASALLAQGDAKAAAAILARAPGIDRNPDLAHAAAESALLAGDEGRACAVAQGLGSGRDEIYWLRLRTFCQAAAGHTDQAQLTFDLAQAQAKDAVFGRLMGAKLAGAGAPGAASLRNGLDLALSRSLGLDLAAAKPSPEVAAALSGGDPAAGVDLSGVAPDLADLAKAIAANQPMGSGVFMTAISEIAQTGPKAAARGQAAIMLAFALDDLASIEARDQLGTFTVGEGRAPLGRDLALDAAGRQKLMGEAALLSLWTCAEAGPSGLAIGDRVRIVRALHLAGLEADARAFALEGLLALK